MLGLIKCFGSLRVEAPAAKATILAAGISEAVLFTIICLVVALPAILIHSVLGSRPRTRN
jgi:biopolymer transport protein ExbB/TolQ